MDYRENYKLWLEEKSLDPKLRAELEAIADDPREQEERFYTELEFGTAGLRGIIGAGTNRQPQPPGVQRLQGILAARRAGRAGAGLGDIGIYPQGGLL